MTRTPVKRGRSVKVAEKAPEEGLDGALEGAVFPLEPGSLAVVARSNGASQKIIRMLAGLPERSFSSVVEIRGVLPPR